MKKFLTTLLLAVLAIGILPVQAQVASTDELTELAAYIPEESPLFLVTRSDPGFIETLDGLGANVAGQVGFPVASPLSEALEDSATLIDPEGDFETLIGRWLGDTVAIAALSPDQFFSTGSLYAFMSVTDELTASKYINLAIEATGHEDDYTVSEFAGGTLYAAPQDMSWYSSYWLAEDVLVVSDNSYDGFLYEPPQATLADSATFTETLGLLPEPAYHALAYIDVPVLMDRLLTENPMDEDVATYFPDMDFEAVLTSTSAQAWGFTILEGRSLTVDFAQTVDIAAMEAAGFDWSASTSINTDFASYVPADAALVLQDSDLGASILETLNMLTLIGEAVSARQGEYYTDPMYYYSQADAEQAMAMLDETVTFLRLAYQGLSGTPLEESLAWMTGDYAVYLGFPLVNDERGLDVGVVQTVTDPAAAESFSQSLQAILDSWGASYQQEGNIVTLSSLNDLVTRAQEADLEAGISPISLDILFGYNDAIFALGTRSGVESAFNGGESLADSAIFQAAAAYMLPETQALAYVNGDNLSIGLDWLAEQNPRDAAELAMLANIMESASLTASYDETGTGLVRFVVTLSQ